MKCLKPLELTNPERRVPCGHCNYCLSRRRADWAFRLLQELKQSTTALFLTFTYADENLVNGSEGPTLDKEKFITFHNTLKKRQSRILKKMLVDHGHGFRQGRKYYLSEKAKEFMKDWKIKYYSVGEYDAGGRPHYHSIMFNIHTRVLDLLVNDEIWNQGWVHAGQVTSASINYVAKYVIDRDMNKKDQRPFALMSKGIGAKYLEYNYKHHKEGMKNFVLVNGRRQRLPRYYKDKIFDDYEKEYFGLIGRDQEEKRFNEELHRLKSMGVERPHSYMREKFIHEHDKIRIKSLKLNKR